MALTSTVYHLRIELSDLDRQVYETLDLRVARHPSETMRYMLTRVIAYCLCYEEGMAFSKGGLSAVDETPLAVRDLRGDLQVAIEIGTPAADRLHRVSKSAPRTVVFTHNDVAQLHRAVSKKAIHRVADIEVYALAPAFLDALAEATERTSSWSMVLTEGQLYVTVGDKAVAGAVTRHALEG
jgi:uncharacterized protein YaeQ